MSVVSESTPRMSALESLKHHSIVVADTGEVRMIAQFSPRDATTNPSLILAAVRTPAYHHFLHDAIGRNPGATLDVITDALLVRFGVEILSHIPGRVSTEIDARLSFNTRASILRARRIIDLYEKAGVARARVLVKLAATWEGIEAARRLELEGISCNLTLVFGMSQALACADAKVRLISPFVGRITDWHKRRSGWDGHAQDDPGVRSVAAIYRYYKKFGVTTEIMAASFRNTGQIRALAGCDLLTISPALLAELQADSAPVAVALSARKAAFDPQERISCDEAQFRYALNADEMVHDKLAEGIRQFAADALQLDALIAAAAP